MTLEAELLTERLNRSARAITFMAGVEKLELDCLDTLVIFAKLIGIGMSTHGSQCLSFAQSSW